MGASGQRQNTTPTPTSSQLWTPYTLVIFSPGRLENITMSTIPPNFDHNCHGHFHEMHDDSIFQRYRELMAEPGESLSSTLAGLRESYNDYYVVKQPDHTEM